MGDAYIGGLAREDNMKTLHTAYRVSELDRSVEFYAKLGFREVGRVSAAPGLTLAMLKLPGDDVVTVELVSDAAVGRLDIGNGLSHIVVQVDDLDATLSALSALGVAVETPQRPGGPAGPTTSFVADPDDYRIELVEWPPGH